MKRCSSPEFRKRFVNILTGQNIIVNSVSRSVQQAGISNAQKVGAAVAAASCLLSVAADEDMAQNADDPTEMTADDPTRKATPTETTNGPQQQTPLLQQPQELPQVRKARHVETQGGGKGMAAQTGKVVNRKPNNGRLPVVGPPRKVRKPDDSDSSSEFRLSERSESSDASSVSTPKVKRKRKVAKKVQEAHTETDAGNSDISVLKEDGASEDEDGDHDDSDRDETDNEELDNGDEDGDSEEDAVPVPTMPTQKVKRVVLPPLIGDGHCELPKTFVDLPDTEPPIDTDYSDTDDGGNTESFATHLAYADNGTILVNDDAEGSEGVDDDPDADDNPLRVVTISNRSKFYAPLKDQRMKAFERILRHDKHEMGCYLSLGNPPNRFDFSDSLRQAAEDEAAAVYQSHLPLDESTAREAKFKEKVFDVNHGGRIKPVFGADCVAVAEALHKYANYSLSALLKTAPLGSTFYEAVNHCSLAKFPTVSMMLRSQVDPYRTIFTSATSFMTDLHYELQEEEIPHEELRMAVLEMMFRTKSINRSRVNSHKKNDAGEKVELAKRQARMKDKRDVDFD